MTNETAIEVKSLRERIAEVNAQNDRDAAEENEKTAQRRRQKLTEQLRERLGIEVEESAITMRNHETPIVEVEGFRFSLGSPSDFEHDLCLLITCGACGKEYSRSIWSINSMADRFVPYPHANRFCLELEKDQAPTSLTTELRLIQVLRDFIVENSYRPE